MSQFVRKMAYIHFGSFSQQIDNTLEDEKLQYVIDSIKEKKRYIHVN